MTLCAASRCSVLCGALLCCLGSNLAAQEASFKVIGDGVREFVAVSTGESLVLMPKSLQIRSDGQPGISIIVQEGMGVGTANPFFVNVTISYGFVADPDSVSSALLGDSSNSKNYSLAQSMAYTSSVGIWDVEQNEYVLRTLDGGSTTYASSLVVTFEIEFSSIEELGEFFEQPRPLILVTETQPQFELVATRSVDELRRAVRAAINSKSPSTTLPVMSIYLDFIKSNGNQLRFDPNDVISEINKEVASASLQLDDAGEPQYVPMVTNGAISEPAESRVRTALVIDRIVSHLAVDVCGSDTQILIIDNGTTGCESIADLVEAKK